MRTPADQPTERSAALDALTARIRTDHGGVITAELTAGQLQTLLDDLWRAYLPAYDNVAVRLVLGAACATRHAAVRQLVAALQLPYAAAEEWDRFLDALGDRPAAERECVVVADADELLPHDGAGRRELLEFVRQPFACMGGGFSTVVLVTILR
jgi:hypothetical protein